MALLQTIFLDTKLMFEWRHYREIGLLYFQVDEVKEFTKRNQYIIVLTELRKDSNVETGTIWRKRT